MFVKLHPHHLLLALAAFLFTTPALSAVQPVACSQQMFDARICPTVGEAAILVSYWLPDDDGFVCDGPAITDRACLPNEIGRAIPSSARRLLAPFMLDYQATLTCTRELVASGICTQPQIDTEIQNPVSVLRYASDRIFQFGIANQSKAYEAQVAAKENAELQRTKRLPRETSPK